MFVEMRNDLWTRATCFWKKPFEKKIENSLQRIEVFIRFVSFLRGIFDREETTIIDQQFIYPLIFTSNNYILRARNVRIDQNHQHSIDFVIRSIQSSKTFHFFPIQWYNYHPTKKKQQQRIFIISRVSLPIIIVLIRTCNCRFVIFVPDDDSCLVNRIVSMWSKVA